MARVAVYKSTAAEVLDDLFGGSPDELAAEYERSLALMDDIGDAPLAEAAARRADEGDLPEDTVEDSRTGWRGDAVVDRIIGEAYRHAIRLAGDSARPEPLPIDTLWVTGATEAFEVHVIESPRRVTVVMCIPLEREYGSSRARSRSWVIRADDTRDGAIVTVQTSGEEPATAG
jgi:hypothetical protein